MDASQLPYFAGPFVGRNDERAEITRLLSDPACRLLTLVGPGGIGKTRLAVEVIQQLPMSDSICFVSLQPLTAPDHIISALADALRFQFYSEIDPKQQLLNFLREKTWLLVLDNFEHLLDAATLVSQILMSAPAVRLLITSRVRLDLIDEWVLVVDGLTYPTSGAEMSTERYGAVELFEHQAGRKLVGYLPSDTDKPAIERICHLVGGMPLAIELAAAWVRVLSCDVIANEIARSLDILETSVRDVEPRHRSMRAVLANSWALLTDAERDVLKKLSVFQGGFGMAAARQVAGASLQMLSTLADKSLIRPNAKGRYDVHELLRQYAADKLGENATEQALTEDEHSAYFAGFMHQRCDNLLRQKQAETSREIEEEIDNVRVAWEHTLSRGNWRELELHLPSQLWFYYASGRLREGETVYETAIAALETGPIPKSEPRILGKLYAQEAFFLVALGRFEEGKELLKCSLKILRPLALQPEITMALICLGSTYIHLGDYAEAVMILQEAETIARTQADEFHLAWALGNHAHLSQLIGRNDSARRQLEECIALLKTRGELVLYVIFLLDFGALLQSTGEYREAQHHYLIGLDVATELDLTLSICSALYYLGDISHALGEDTQSINYLHQCLIVARKFGVLPMLTQSLFCVTRILLTWGGRESAVARLSLIVHHPSTMQEIRDRAQVLLEQLASELPREAFEANHAKGRVAKLEQMLDALYFEPAFARLRSPTSSVGQEVVNHLAGGIAHPYVPDILFGRELDVLRLMGDGLSNREIAAKLHLSVSTIKWYVSRILSKLQATSRAQAVVHARTQGLLP